MARRAASERGRLRLLRGVLRPAAGLYLRGFRLPPHPARRRNTAAGRADERRSGRASPLRLLRPVLQDRGLRRRARPLLRLGGRVTLVPPPVDLSIEGGTVVTAAGRARADVHIRDGRVVGVGPRRPDSASAVDTARIVDAAGLYVLPGMVDTHLHLMDPGPTEREDFPTGTAAAAARGVTTVVEHTHGHPIREAADLVTKRRHLDGRANVDYGLAAHVWPDRIDELGELWRAGVTYFKIFTCTTHGVPGLDPAILYRAFEAIAAFRGSCLVHCEDESLTAEAERRLRAAGRADNAVIIEWRSRPAELVAVQVAALLARLTGVRATIAHVSNPSVAAIVAAERSAGADLAAEACPQYFLLREHEVLEHGAFRKFTPPARARTAADEEEMWDLLRTGVLSHVATDHAPATREHKTEGDIWDVHFGLPGLDTTLPLLLDAAFRDKIALEDVVRVYAEAPARRYGLYPAKGHLGVGADADLVLVDPAPERVLTDGDVISKAGWTPYAGRSVRGAVVATYLRGELVAEHGVPRRELLGRFLPGPGGRA
ncbi:MAG: amidohydrolase family protein [Streptosporangiales bacterium]|nr:amidohydrolase family protein [Streptosporangiales bacterium]